MAAETFMHDSTRIPPRAGFALAALLLASACREKAPAPTDSALAQDLALAQRNVSGPVVFNDAPVGATAPARPAPAAPVKRPEPPRASTAQPRPTPRRESPPAPVTPSPRATTPASVATEPSPAPTPASTVGTIGAGTRIGMTTNGRVCAVNALPGDKYSATVTSATTGSNGAVIPAGATVVIEVASVDRRDPIEQSQINFRVRAIDVDGVARPAEGDVTTLGSLQPVQTASGNDRTKVIGGAIAGAVLGKIFGGSTKATVIGGAAGAAAGAAAAHASRSTDACLPNGSQLALTLSQTMVVRE
jgi:hypothetical protein